MNRVQAISLASILCCRLASVVATARSIRSPYVAHVGAWPSLQRRLIPLLLGTVYVLLITGLRYTVLLSAEATITNAPWWPITHRQALPKVIAVGTSAIFVQGGVAATVGSLVDVPIAFDSAGNHVAALSFSLDYDDSCLALDPADRNHDGLADAIVIDAPRQFIPSVSVNPDGQQGRLDVILADYIPPLAALRDTAALVTIQFRIVCPVEPGFVYYAFVNFAATPAVGFSDPSGRDLPGVARGGVVQVIGSIPTVTPTPTPVSGLPTPTLIPTAPSTPLPTPVVLIELAASPERLTHADRGVILILDYVILTAANNISLTLPIPQHGQFDATASSLGWQCESEVVNPQCHFPLYDATRQNRVSGRLFFAVGLNWPLPAQVTQIEFTVIIAVSGAPSNQTQHLVVPISSAGATPEPDALRLDLDTNNSEFVIGVDHEIAYTFAYTNSSKTVLPTVTFHLVLPSGATIRSSTGGSFNWACVQVEAVQPVCTFFAGELELEATGRAQFVLTIEPPSRLMVMSVIVMAAYATQEGQILSSHISVVPIRQPIEIARLFLPLITNGPKVPEIMWP